MGAAPLYMQDMIKLYHTQLNKQGLRAFSDKRLLLLPGHPETKITRRMFSHHAPTIWNNLPYKLRHCNDTTLFKKDLKTFYYDKF